MDFSVFLNKFIISNRYLRYRPVWFWFRLINHSNWRMDDNIRYWDFWSSLNRGYDDMNYSYEYFKVWKKVRK
jgi:hypothetical protein